LRIRKAVLPSPPPPQHISPLDLPFPGSFGTLRGFSSAARHFFPFLPISLAHIRIFSGLFSGATRSFLEVMGAMASLLALAELTFHSIQIRPPSIYLVRLLPSNLQEAFRIHFPRFLLSDALVHNPPPSGFGDCFPSWPRPYNGLFFPADIFSFPPLSGSIRRVSFFFFFSSALKNLPSPGFGTSPAQRHTLAFFLT